MKFISLLSFLPIFLFSFEIEFNKKFYHTLPHEILKTHLVIRIDDDSEKEVDNRLNKFNELIKEYDKVDKKLASFNIRPNFRHAGNTPTIRGYIGELVYTIESNKAHFMDEFITQITDLKKFRDTSVSITNLSWTIKEATYNVTLDLLRYEAINWAQTYATNLSNDVKKNCSLKKIVINRTPTPIYNKSEYNITESLTVPQANQEMIEINPKFILECK
jgi:uncharacterized protein YggE